MRYHLVVIYFNSQECTGPLLWKVRLIPSHLLTPFYQQSLYQSKFIDVNVLNLSTNTDLLRSDYRYQSTELIYWCQRTNIRSTDVKSTDIRFIDTSLPISDLSIPIYRHAPTDDTLPTRFYWRWLLMNFYQR